MQQSIEYELAALPLSLLLAIRDPTLRDHGTSGNVTAYPTSIYMLHIFLSDEVNDTKCKEALLTAVQNHPVTHALLAARLFEAAMINCSDEKLDYKRMMDCCLTETRFSLEPSLKSMTMRSSCQGEEVNVDLQQIRDGKGDLYTSRTIVVRILLSWCIQQTSLLRSLYFSQLN